MLNVVEYSRLNQLNLVFVGHNSQQSDFNGKWSGQVPGIIPDSSQNC